MEENERAIVRSLLEAYYRAERFYIMERSSEIDIDMQKLDAKCEKYRTDLPSVFPKRHRIVVLADGTWETVGDAYILEVTDAAYASLEEGNRIRDLDDSEILSEKAIE